MKREEYKQIRIKSLFSKILSEWNYVRFMRSMYEADKEKTPLKVEIRDKEKLNAIVIPQSLLEIQRNLLSPMDGLISSILAAFDIEYRLGYTRKLKGLLKLVHDYSGLSTVEKSKLVEYLLTNLNNDGALS